VAAGIGNGVKLLQITAQRIFPNLAKPRLHYQPDAQARESIGSAQCFRIWLVDREPMVKQRETGLYYHEGVTNGRLEE